MRLVSVRDGKHSCVGVQFGKHAYLTHWSMEELLADWPASLARLPRSAEENRVGRDLHALADLQLTAPITQPSKVIGIGMNYADHCTEQGINVPKVPVVFAKFPSAIIGPGEAVTWPAGLTDQVDWEVELAVVIGKKARFVEPHQAVTYIAGYTVANDISARDLQFADGQFVRSKSLDTFCPLGPALVLEDEVPGVHALDIWLDVNGFPMQRSNTSNLVFDAFSLVAFLSRYFTLEPGDVILTGTPPGVGAFRNPPVFLKANDVMVAGIEGIGELVTPVLGPA